MPIRARLVDLVDGMQMQSDEMSWYMDVRTGRVVPVSDDELWAVEAGGEELEWYEPEAIGVARASSLEPDSTRSFGGGCAGFSCAGSRTLSTTKSTHRRSALSA